MLEQGDRGSGAVTRDQVAEVLVRALLSEAALGKTFELYATAGDPPADWNALFAALTPDAPGALDAAKDPHNLPLDAEPRTVRQDLDRIRA